MTTASLIIYTLVAAVTLVAMAGSFNRLGEGAMTFPVAGYLFAYNLKVAIRTPQDANVLTLVSLIVLGIVLLAGFFLAETPAGWREPLEE